ncbi:MAG: glutamine-hydrolyzing GMP synthase [Verrucomicrobia bacterium]|nr:glutamine-hydrolyzing GMP synthase [Verrucomicrobiota bacterium]
MSSGEAFSGSKVVILDFGSQYTQVIARRVRECRVYSEILPFSVSPETVLQTGAKGVVLSGGPASVFSARAPLLNAGIFDIGLPVLGICYGVQLFAHFLGGRVEYSDRREYGPSHLRRTGRSPLFEGLPDDLQVWNSHGDKITSLPPGFVSVGVTENSPYAAIEHPGRKLYGLQFHPEVAHTPLGKEVLENFLYRICGCEANWTMGSFIEQTCREISARVGKDKVVLALSGGVDSSVAAALLHRALGDRLTCIFVNNGLLRTREAETVQRVFGENFHIKLRYVNASSRFLARLRGVIDPEQKRKIIGEEFIRVFEETTRELKARDSGDGRYHYLAQGTLYPDVIESVAISGNPAALIKSHHNVGGLPEKMDFELIEPLRQLFKDEVRQVGLELELPREIVFRQPFPGPGLGVRILGEITEERLNVLRQADEIVVSEMKAADWYYKVWQSFAILLPIRSVGVMGDQRTYDDTVAIRIVESQDGMTADWVRIPYEILARLSARIINEVQGVNRVCYDVSSKPPSTIEWE